VTVLEQVSMLSCLTSTRQACELVCAGEREASVIRKCQTFCRKSMLFYFSAGKSMRALASVGG